MQSNENIELIGGLIAGIAAIIFTLEKLLDIDPAWLVIYFGLTGKTDVGLHSPCQEERIWFLERRAWRRN